MTADLGVLKFLKPFKFKNPHLHRSDGFRCHGVFFIQNKRRLDDGSWMCKIRRVATCWPNCPIDELVEFHEKSLIEMTVYTNLDCFK